MPFDGTPPVPGLSVPSLENLAYVLRHRETWPRGFEWDYRFGPSCAIGLSAETWPGNGLSYRLPRDIIVGVRPPDRWFEFFRPFRGMEAVTASMVADAIDHLLARQ